MNKNEAIIEITRLRKLIAEEVEWNFGYMTNTADVYLQQVFKLEKQFELPSSVE